MRWPRVLIAGGSIGGLTTAVLLAELGCEVEAYERSTSALEDRGAGIVVLPVTERYFRERRSDDKRVSLELTYWIYVDSEGNVISADRDHYRFSGWSTIYRALLETFGRDRYHFDHQVVDFSIEGATVTARFADGSSADGDLLVFADGSASTGRSLILPEVQPVYAEYVAWRGTIPEARLSARARADLADAMVYQVLDLGHILVYAIPDPQGRTTPPDRTINYVWYRNYPAGGPYEDLMVDVDGVRRTGTMPPGSIRPEHLAELRATSIDTLAPTLREVVLGCDRPLIQAVFDVHSPRMAFGRVCLIGDAATTLRPHIAAGQAKACADAWALRDALVEADGDVEAALVTWEPGQLALARASMARSTAMGRASQFEGTMVPGDPNWKFGLWEAGN
jgi:2,6-dihydroxypyridine 3-monooxygenase